MNLFNALNDEYTNVVIPIQTLFNKKGYKFFTGEFNTNLIGIRMNDQKLNKFSDLFLLIYMDHSNKWHVERATGTTVPGDYYHYNYHNPNGLGIIVPDQYRGAFKSGLHRGRPALIQNTTFKVFRDTNKDGKIDKVNIMDAPPSSGFNFHNAVSTKFPNKIYMENIGKFSEGCQVLANRVKYQMFLDIIEYSMNLWNSNSSTYTLLEEDDFK
jgi:hypothetical protein